MYRSRSKQHPLLACLGIRDGQRGTALHQVHGADHLSCWNSMSQYRRMKLVVTISLGTGTPHILPHSATFAHSIAHHAAI
jgi:hypothetical protein